jgi:hypothetical protein
VGESPATGNVCRVGSDRISQPEQLTKRWNRFSWSGASAKSNVSIYLIFELIVMDETVLTRFSTSSMIEVEVEALVVGSQGLLDYNQGKPALTQRATNQMINRSSCNAAID